MISLGFSGGHVFRGVQDRRVHLADDLFRLVAIEAARALVPQQNLSVEVFPDNGVLRRGLEDVAYEVKGLLFAAENPGVEKLRGHDPPPQHEK
jgi:hypothetical protein